jgi:hypothetical protein
MMIAGGIPERGLRLSGHKYQTELHKPGEAICLEGKGLSIRMLVVYGMDGQYHTFINRSTFMGRRLDPVASKQTVRSCNLFRSVLIIRAM